MVIQRGKVIDMLKQMAKAEEIPADVQLIITQRLLDNGEQLKPDREELEYALSEDCYWPISKPFNLP